MNNDSFNNKPFEYFAFISYKREDEKWAKWLQKKLESYSLPTALRKENPNLPSKIRPIFRDQSELSGGNLKTEIEKGLNESKYLIVICSPRSAKSPWVSKEVQYFIDQGRENFIIPFIIGGTPNATNPEDECFPEGLRQLTGEKELLGININEMGRDAAAIKVIARMFGLRFDTLWQRHEKDKNRRRILVGACLFLALIISAAVYAYIVKQKADVEHAIKAQQLQRLYNEFLGCEKSFTENKFQQTFKSCKDIMLSDVEIPDTLRSQFEYLLRMSYASIQSDTLSIVDRYKANFPAMDWGSMPVVFNADGSRAYVGCSGFSEIETSTGKCINRAGFWPEKIVVRDGQLYSFDDYNVTIYDLESLAEIKSLELKGETGYHEILISPSADGRRFLTINSNTDCHNVYDTATGQLIKTFEGSSYMASINHDGSVIALIDNGKLRLYDINRNKPIDDIAEWAVSDLQFDESGRWLLIYIESTNTVHLFNPDSRESYTIYNIGQWRSSYNFDGNSYGNKYIVSDDDRYIAIGPRIYELHTGKLFKQLEDAEDAMGLKIFPDASKVIQINLEQEILIYTRKGKSLFDACNIDFQELLNNDPTATAYTIEHDKFGTITVKEKSGNVIGIIHNVDGDLYNVSISPDKKYALVSSLAIPTSLYDLSTGTLIHQFPFLTGDGDAGYGVFGHDGYLYFNNLDCVLKYHLPTVDEILKYEIK